MNWKKLFLIALVAGGFAFAPAPRAEAGVSVGIGVGFPGVSLSVLRTVGLGWARFLLVGGPSCLFFAPLLSRPSCLFFAPLPSALLTVTRTDREFLLELPGGISPPVYFFGVADRAGDVTSGDVS